MSGLDGGQQPLAPTPSGRRYRRPASRQSSLRRRIWRLARAGVERARETQWMVPVAAIITGMVGAWVAGTFGQHPDQSDWTVSVDRARDSLMGLLSLVFAGMSIVLAVGSVTTQNVVSRFSLRMLRLYQRDLRDKAVIGTFALTASFIMTEQYRLRGLPPDDLAPVPGVTISLLLIFVSGVMTIWYLSVLAGWFRVDRTAKRVAREALLGARSLTRRYADFDLADRSLLERPPDAVPFVAPRSGHLAGLDFDWLYDHAIDEDAVVVIDRLDGSSLLRGESIGWISPTADRRPSVPTPEVLDEVVDVADSVTLEGAVDYRITVLVDIAIMALSPAVNDPNTAVEIIDEMTFLFAEFASVEMGPAVLADESGQPRVVVDAMGFGDYLDLATEQIVLYGATDPALRRSLERLIDVLSALDLPPGDRAAVERLRNRLEVATGSVT